MDNVTLLGTLGAFIVLVAFVMNQTHRWKEDDLVYDVTNFIGSCMLVAYAIILKSYPFAFLNLVWAGVSLLNIYEDRLRTKN